MRYRSRLILSGLALLICLPTCSAQAGAATESKQLSEGHTYPQTVANLDRTRPEKRRLIRARHPGEGQDPAASATYWVPASAGTTQEAAAGWKLDSDAKLDFALGRALFRRTWVTAPASTQAADGLGPLYNARSCVACHPGNGRGTLPEGDGSANALLLRIDIPAQNDQQRKVLAARRSNNLPDPTYGLQLQGFAVPGHSAEHRLAVSYEEIPLRLGDGSRVNLRKPSYSTDALGYGPLHPQARLSPRIAPQLLGLGLLEAIEERDILAREDPADRDGDGISGRANRVWSPLAGMVRVGRFGHKAGTANIDEQTQAAFSIDLGLSVALYPLAAGDCSERQRRCRAAPNGNSEQYQNLEAHRQITDLVSFYLRHLAAPARSPADAQDSRAGEQLFQQLGCDGCHTPRYRTGAQSAAAANHGVEIAPYTDLLLHDMGDGLADNRPEGTANGREWRTAPLWGIGQAQRANGRGNYLHDGRARTLLEAILWHGGEAAVQRAAVAVLGRDERDRLLAFLESL